MDHKTIIVIGGLSAGPSAAAKARREDENARIILFEKTEHVSYATCGIPYSMSGKIKNQDKLLVVKPELLEQRFNIEVHLEEPVLDIEPENHEVKTPEGTYTYDKLIFAVGAMPFTPPIEGLEQSESWSHARTIEDLNKIMEEGIVEGKEHISILGAGLIGVEVAENLTKIGKKVHLIELAPQVLPTWDSKFAHMAEKVLQEKGVEVRTNTTVSKAISENGQLKQLELKNGEVIQSDFLILALGGKPNTAMLTDKGAEHLPNGALKVNDKMETSLPDVYAAGDCASIKNIQTGEHDYFPMGTHSNKGGRAAGANAAGGHEIFKGAYRTAIVKVFDYTLARTGFNPRTLKMSGMPFESTFIAATSTPGFYPDPKDVFMEVYYHPETRKVLGAEVFGEKGIDKRIDVLGTAIYGKLTVDDLPNLDLAYAPPFSPAKDPVIVAGFVSGNKARHDFQEISTNALEDLIRKNEEEFQILDVRNPVELDKEGKIKGAKNIPLDSLREDLSGLKKDTKTIVYCARGLRGYLASLILMHHGFTNIHNLGGGFKAWANQGKSIENVKEMV